MKKYFTVFLLSARHSLKNVNALIGLSIFLITCLIIFSNLWKIAAAKAGAQFFEPDKLLWYIALNEWVLIAIPDVHEEMQEDLHTGKLAYLLPRPISYLGSTFAAGLGSLFVNLTVLGLVTFGFTYFAAGGLPFHPTVLIPATLFGFLSGILGVLFSILIGLSAFWLSDVSPLQWIWEKFLLLLGGLMLPLTVYPLWMQNVAYFTPFPLILGSRSALAIDFSIEALVTLTLALAVWSILVVACLLFIYRKGMLILTIGGG